MDTGELLLDKSLFIEVLEYLYIKGIKYTIDIYPIVNKYFPADKDYQTNVRNTEIEKYINNIQDCGYIWFRIYKKNLKDTNLDNCELVINAQITVSGFQFISDFTRDQSILNTNKIIRRYTRAQTLILFFVMVISAFTLVYSYFTYQATLLSNKELPHQKTIQPQVHSLTTEQDTNRMHSKISR